MSVSPRGLRNVCVFCGSSSGRLEAYREAAAGLGRVLAERGLGLVYGGGNVGLMGVVADAVLAAGGRAVGVIPHAMVRWEVAHDGLDELLLVDSMHERKQRMHELSDAFIALPGGMGTLEELFETLTWIQLGLHDKPCGLLDVGGYFAPLLAMLDRATGEGFIRPEHRNLLLADDDPGRLLDRFATVELPPRRRWVDASDL